jgi:hypothetical protein
MNHAQLQQQADDWYWQQRQLRAVPRFTGTLAERIHQLWVYRQELEERHREREADAAGIAGGPPEG